MYRAMETCLNNVGAMENVKISSIFTRIMEQRKTTVFHFATSYVCYGRQDETNRHYQVQNMPVREIDQRGVICLFFSLKANVFTKAKSHFLLIQNLYSPSIDSEVEQNRLL